MRLNRLFLILILTVNIFAADYYSIGGYVTDPAIDNLPEWNYYDGFFNIHLVSTNGYSNYTTGSIGKWGDNSGTYWKKDSLPIGWRGYAYASRNGYSMEPNAVLNLSPSNYIDINFLAVDTAKPQLYFVTRFPNDTIHHNYYGRDSIPLSLYLDIPETLHIAVYDNSALIKNINFHITYDGNLWESINNKPPPCSYTCFFARDTSRAVFDAHAFFIPDKPTSSFQVRVIAADYSGHKDTIYSQLLSVHDTVKPVININSPAGDETWHVGVPQNITWTATDNDSIYSRTIYLSLDGGTNYTVLNNSNTNTGTWQWTPSKVSDQCRIKIIAYDHSNSASIQSSIFTVQDTVKPTVTLSSPNGGESWLTGSTHTVHWSASDNMELFNRAIYISYNNGSNWSLIDSGEYSSSYNWTLPDNISQECLVKIMVIDSSDNASSDISNAAFSIIPPAPNTVTLINPADGAVNVPIQTTFKWNKIASATGYEICVSSDNYSTYKANQTVMDTFFTLSGMSYQMNYKWKVRALNAGGEGPWSEALFQTVERAPQGSPVIINPLNNAEGVSINTVLLWHPVPGSEKYEIQFTNLNEQKVIFHNKDISDTSYPLTNLKKNTLYYWTLRGKNDGGYSIYSSAKFRTIGAPGSIAMVTPEDGGILSQDSVEIRWNNTEYCDSFHIIIRRHSGSVLIIDTFVTDTALILKNLDNALYDISINSINETGTGPVNFSQFVINRPMTDNMNKGPILPVISACKKEGAININLPSESRVLLDVFDMRGRWVITYNEVRPAGLNVINVANIAAGNYIMILRIKDFHKKMTFSKGF